MTTKTPPVIVSACLAGIQCNYKGLSSPSPKVIQLIKEGKAIPVCPEQLGGLTTPRTPSERKDNKVITKTGEDVTMTYQKGADEACRLCTLVGCKKAILKARSPSCGCHQIYDGTFTGHLIPKDGVLAEKLKQLGIEVISDEDL